MIERMLVLVAALAAAWVAIAVLERRRPAGSVGLAAGVTLISGPGCGLCEAVRRRLHAVGIDFREVDLGEVSDLDVRSLPTLMVVAGDGTVTWRRSGRSAVADAGRVAEMMR